MPTEVGWVISRRASDAKSESLRKADPASGSVRNPPKHSFSDTPARSEITFFPGCESSTPAAPLGHRLLKREMIDGFRREEHQECWHRLTGIIDMFIAIEGADGTGKTTQVDRLCRWLEREGHNVVRCRDPGGTALGETVRDILLHKQTISVDPRTEALLYMASRAQLVAEIIRPAIESRAIVVSDRFLLSNIAYQGYGFGLSVESLRQIGQFATGGIWPDVTFILDMPVAEALQRIQRSPDRLESRGIEYLERVRDGFLQEASRLADRVTVVRADRDPDEVEAAIRRIVQAYLK